MTQQPEAQDNLFEVDPAWKEEWVGMPEFVQDNLEGVRKLVIHFKTDEDVIRFAKLIGQKITPKQRALWFPPIPNRRYADKRYIDNPDES